MTTRRDLLTGAVAVVTAPLLPIPALAAPPRDPLADMAAEYFRLIAVANATQTDDELDAASEAVSAVRERILATPATTLAGVLAKMRGAAEAGLVDEDLSGRFALSAIDDLSRMAAGASP